MIRGAHLLWLTAIGLAAMSVRATESYATRYQSLPVLDWLESRPPLAQSAGLPAADDLARGVLRAAPLLTISEDAQSRSPMFGPPSQVQRTMNGVRDAARIELSTPELQAGTIAPIVVRLDVVVFNRHERARAYAQLFDGTMDVRDPESGAASMRLSGPDEADALWVVAPRAGGGVATLNGVRGAVDFTLQVSYARGGETTAADLIDLSARAEALARQIGADYARWLERQVA